MRILKPDAGSHCGDTFRELVGIWEELGYCQVTPSPDDFCWMEECGDVLLYDFPRLDDRSIPKFRHGLFGNSVPVYPNCYAWTFWAKFRHGLFGNSDPVNPNCYAWTFWARSPRLLMEARKTPLLGYKEREIDSIFLGKIENAIQNSNRRNQDWSSAGIDVFHCPVDRPGPDHYLFTKQEYLEHLSHSRFGLALAGYGPKCNREIELLGMGVVPLFAPEVDNTYHEPLIEGTHFLYVTQPSDLKKVIDSVSESQWQEMHEAGQDWYNRNASPEGSFNLTKTIVDNIKLGK